jgi:hypothetical protein
MESKSLEIEIDCYTDASYSQQKSTSIIAYKIQNNPIKTIEFKDIKNTQAELLGIEFCIGYTIQNYPNVKIINIYTDCQNAWKQNYSNYKNHKQNQIQINLIKIKGHQQMELMNGHDLIFKQVDKMARKTLRNL